MPSSESRLSEALSHLNPLRRRASLAKSIRSISSAFSRKSRESIKSNWDADSQRSERSRYSYIAEVQEPGDKTTEVKEMAGKKKKAQAQAEQKTSTVPTPVTSSSQAIDASARKKKKKSAPPSKQSNAIYMPKIHPAILRDPEATKKLLDTISESPGGKRSLSRLARTCKGFSEPALNTLWRELDSLVPVVGVFPTVLLKKVRKPGLGLSKAPEAEDWSGVMSYGERVRQIIYNEASNALSPSIFPHFESNRPRKYMLPNLQHLLWKTETSAGLDYCEMFLNPELESLTLEMGARSPKLVPLLSDVSKRMTLKSFSFSSSIALPESFVDIMAPQDALQRVILVAPGALSPAVGRWVASLPELKSLQMDLSRRSVIAVEGFFDEMPGSGASTPSSVGTTDSGVFSGEELDFSDHRKSALRLTGDLKSRGTFVTMRQLHLTGEASNVAVFLKFFASPLTHLDLLIDDPPDSIDWQDLINMVGRFAQSLQSLRISATASSRFSDLVRSTPRADQPTGRLSLEYLSSFPALNRLEIDLPESIHFIAADIARVATCCPNLEELKLCPFARFPVATGPPKLTLEALAPLMAECPLLHTISVAVNGQKGSSGMLSEPGYSSDSLRRCHFGHSWINDPLHVAILLSHLAPKLDSLKWFHERNRPGFIETNARGWEKVSDMLPHLQQVRLSERNRARRPPPEKIIEYVEVLPPPIPTKDKCIGPEIVMHDQGVLVRPMVVEFAAQCAPQLVHTSVEAIPETTSVQIDAVPCVEEVAVDASVDTMHRSVDATPVTIELPVDATPSITSKSVEALVPKNQQRYRRTSYHILPSIFSMLSFTCRVLIAYPMSIPMRIIHAIMYNSSIRRMHSSERDSSESSSSHNDNDDISMTTVQDADCVKPTPENWWSVCVCKGNRELMKQEINIKETLKEMEREVQVQFWYEHCDGQTRSNKTATRQTQTPRSTSYCFQSPIMSDNKKQEKDFTPEVEVLLPEAESLVKAGKLQEALDKLFSLEKQTRNAADLASTTRLLKVISQHCYDARDYTQLNNSISTLSKKHGQLKAAIQAMVELSMSWLEEVRQRDGTKKWLELVHTLREVTEGKIFLETPRARVTLLLSQYHEDLASKAKAPEDNRKSMETASELLSDLQVETYSSMERREKTEFILEQMRLLIAVARRKDETAKDKGKDSTTDGESEWVKARVGGRKVNEEFLKEKDNEDLKLKYYDLMIQHALHYSSYLDVAKYYHKVWETPSIKEDVNDKGKAALEHIVYYVVLASHDNEQSDMLHRLFVDPALEKLQLHYNLVKCFTTRELMRWPGIVEIYGEFLRKTPVFSLEKRWEDLHTRIIEHNIRVIAAYYTRITISRLTSLLDLTRKQTEETLARLVVSKTIWARIDRPAEIINFRSPRSAEDVMNDWSSDMQKLLGMVEKTWMGMNAAQAAQSRIRATASS
ncbi:hypothetical protein E1B28_000864 [Marasmius oreades]|uniref:PCI domain-containing protein n=1 Tax=Marasmius oreades TaxID=181124 RepID=A0A9P7V2F6_9AGAR|nr:uncharacterized protein E1B28_000864 [Marasmius oreades]KAG7098977.1 hypothetical protein E1B28_000864 [Marasmius oreades]